MSLFRRFWRCLKENGLRYTLVHMWERWGRWVREKTVMRDYYGGVRGQIDRFQKEYPARPKRTAVHMVWWNVKALFKRHEAPRKAPAKRAGLAKNAPDYRLTLTKDELNIGFLLNGGLGDFLIEANYIYKFRERYGWDHIRIDVFAHNSFSAAQSIFRPGSVIDGLYPEEGYSGRFRDYDLFIHISRYPDVKRRQLDRIAELAPEIVEYVFLCERFRAENDRFFSKPGITDGQSAMLSILKGIKRPQQPDVYGFLGVTERYEYPLGIYADEHGYLAELGLDGRPFITLHRGCDTRYSENSVKLWPVRYYDILIRLLKERYPELILVQIGVSHDRCLDMEGIDLDLVEQTNLEQVKILLKHSVLHIDGEGGMVHLRHALCAQPSVVMFGPTSPEFFGYEENVNLRGKGCDIWCEWAVRGWMEKCLRGCAVPPCMASLVPEHVFQAVVKTLERGRDR